MNYLEHRIQTHGSGSDPFRLFDSKHSPTPEGALSESRVGVSGLRSTNSIFCQTPRDGAGFGSGDYWGFRQDQSSKYLKKDFFEKLLSAVEGQDCDYLKFVDPWKENSAEQWEYLGK
jgi:hypothetical protein